MREGIRRFWLLLKRSRCFCEQGLSEELKEMKRLLGETRNLAKTLEGEVEEVGGRAEAERARVRELGTELGRKETELDGLKRVLEEAGGRAEDERERADALAAQLDAQKRAADERNGDAESRMERLERDVRDTKGRNEGLERALEESRGRSEELEAGLRAVEASRDSERDMAKAHKLEMLAAREEASRDAEAERRGRLDAEIRLGQAASLAEDVVGQLRAMETCHSQGMDEAKACVEGYEEAVRDLTRRLGEAEGRGGDAEAELETCKALLKGVTMRAEAAVERGDALEEERSGLKSALEEADRKHAEAHNLLREENDGLRARLGAAEAALMDADATVEGLRGALEREGRRADGIAALVELSEARRNEVRQTRMPRVLHDVPQSESVFFL